MPAPILDDPERVIYMDHAATTPVRPEVMEAMLPHFSEQFGNPSSLYALAQESRNAVDESRERVAGVLGCRTGEVVFTSGGTESDNAAVKGAAGLSHQPGRHVVTTAIEHHAVIHSCEQLERTGYEVTYISPDADGVVDPAEVADAVRTETVLVSVMLANNEVGVIQDIGAITDLVRDKAAALDTSVLCHTDAVQAAGKLPLDVDSLGVDLLSLSGHKIHGPKGVGALYVRRGTPIEPLIAGGGQERQRRSGTENVPGIVGFGVALELADYERHDFNAKCERLRERIVAGVRERVPDVVVNGHPDRRLSNIAHMSFPGVEGEPVLLGLDFAGICASSGSACSSASLEPSHVLIAMGMDADLAVGSVRLSLGRDNTEADADAVVEALTDVLGRLRSMPSLLAQGVG